MNWLDWWRVSGLFRGMNSPKRRTKVLVQLHAGPKLQVGAIFFSLALLKLHNARAVPFHPRSNSMSSLQNRMRTMSQLIAVKVFLGRFAGYGLLRPQTILGFSSTAKNRTIAQRWVPEKLSLESLEALTVDGVHVGDLIYDEYLQRSRMPTIDLSSSEFQYYLLEALELVDRWLKYFRRNNVVAVVSTGPYLQGLPLRIAAVRGIDAYEVYPESHEIRFLSANYPYSRMETKFFPSLFRELSETERVDALRSAKDRLESRLTGTRDPLLKNSFQWKISEERPLDRTEYAKSKKILVATHDFLDSPHVYSVGLFPDFYQWLHWLGEATRGSEYEWKIKAHPDSGGISARVIREIVARFPHFQYVAGDVSNRQLMAEGLRCVVTCYGTVGIEFPYFGIPVVNCDPNNPHRAYSFNYHPRSIAELELLLENVGSLKVQGSLEEILECFFMQNLSNWYSFFYDFESQPSDVWGHVLTNLEASDCIKIIGGYSDFIQSGRYWFEWSKFGAETALNRP